jgi:flagellar hook-associated protein 2
MSSITRLTGMATGMDTDSTVKKLMTPYQLRIDKLTQNKQLVQWKQDAYRDIMSDLNNFKSSYFDYKKTDNYMLQKSAYAGFDVSVVDSGTTVPSKGVSVIANVGAVAGNYKVDFTNGNLAMQAAVTSNSSIKTTGALDAVATTKLSDIGVAFPISIDITYNNGTGDVTKPIVINTDMTLSELAQAINTGTNSEVLGSFSELTGKFTMKTSNTGANTNINITGNASLIAKLDLIGHDATGVVTPNQGLGKDLKVEITPPGGSSVTINKSSNIFTADGVTYNFTSDKDNLGNAPLVSNINITPNVQKPFDKIKSLIDKYNEIIGNIKSKIDEKTQKSYLPLTDEQKKDMSADEIKTWEVKAKQGLLRNDPILSNMLTAMRSAFYTKVEGAGVSLSEIGLSTSVDYTQGGKILIDETKLKDALQTRGDQVVNLFSQPSVKVPTYSSALSSDDRVLRNSDQGIFQRINDIFEDNTKTTGKKGLLLEKAGIKGNYTEFNNLLTTDMVNKQKYIDLMKTRMATKEDQYYSQFAKLETAMNKMNSQSSWIAQQMGGQ